MLLAFAFLMQLAGAELQDESSTRDMRDAQARFERTRRAHMPLKPSGGRRRHCDAHIGRICYWYDSTDSVVEPEHPRVVAARRDLIGQLSAAARTHPGNRWLVGQLVRYQLEAGAWEEAAAFAGTECSGTRWWCLALLGTALHVGQQYSRAEAAFARALDRMPPLMRCAWEDMRPVVEARLARQLAGLDCEMRRAVTNVLWKLGQPLWLAGGSDLQTEHLARLTIAAFMDGAATPSDMSFGRDSRELILRYGVSEWFTRSESRPAAYPTIDITGHSRSPSYYFVPVAEVRPAGVHTASLAWRMTDSLARSRYAPRHVKRMSALAHQVARFPRGDSILVLASYRVSDTAISRDRASFAFGLWDGRTVHVQRAIVPGRAMATIVNDSVVVSIEVHDSVSRHAQRARLPVAPISCQPGWCLSDLLFTAAAGNDSGPEPEVALATALPDARIDGGVPLGVYWEMHAAGRDPVNVSLTVTPLRVSLLRRVASALRMGRAVTPVRLQWQSVPRREREGHLVTVRLPDDLRGRFHVRLVVERPGLTDLSAEREVVVSR